MNNRLRTERRDLLSIIMKTGRRVTFNPEVKVENYNSDPFFMVNCFDLY